jgi:hypothetical protein
MVDRVCENLDFGGHCEGRAIHAQDRGESRLELAIVDCFVGDKRQCPIGAQLLGIRGPVGEMEKVWRGEDDLGLGSLGRAADSRERGGNVCDLRSSQPRGLRQSFAALRAGNRQPAQRDRRGSQERREQHQAAG